MVKVQLLPPLSVLQLVAHRTAATTGYPLQLYQPNKSQPVFPKGKMFLPPSFPISLFHAYAHIMLLENLFMTPYWP